MNYWHLGTYNARNKRAEKTPDEQSQGGSCKPYLPALFAALTFAHLARCAAAIFLRTAADNIVFCFGFGTLTTFCYCPRDSAHRAR